MGLIEALAPDVILLDMVFPESTTGGFDAAQAIKTKHPRLPIIAFSAVNREYSLTFTREQIQVDEFFTKPVHADTLVKAIRRLVR